LDILCAPDALKGLAGSGTVHHIAFATPNQDTQLEVRSKIVQRMLNTTPVLDRKYFTSIYFREPGGVLFEVATSGPGFSVDEPVEHLGEALMLPPQFEANRAHIEKTLVPVRVNLNDYK
jgi:glyoxalase family protein